MPDEEAEKDGATNTYSEIIHCRENLKRTGYVIYTVRMVFFIVYMGEV